MPVQKRRIIGLDIGATAVKVVQSNGGSRNWKFGSAQLPDGVITGGVINSSKLLAATVKKAMSAGRIHGGSASLSISGGDVIIRSAVYPRMNADQLRQNVIDEITGYLSVKPELYHIDYKITEVLTEGTAQQYRVMIVAVPKNTVTPYLQALSAAGLKVNSVDVASNVKEKLINALVGSVQHYAIIDLGMNSTIIDTFQNNRYFINKVSQASVNTVAQELATLASTDQLQATEMLFGDSPSEACTKVLNGYVDQVAFDALRVLDYFRSRNNQQPVTQVYLCGGGTAIPGILSSLREKLDIPVNSMSDVLSGLLTGSTPSSGSLNLASYACAAGATLMEVDG